MGVWSNARVLQASAPGREPCAVLLLTIHEGKLFLWWNESSTANLFCVCVAYVAFQLTMRTHSYDLPRSIMAQQHPGGGGGGYKVEAGVSSTAADHEPVS
jgi:hypothetical protein